MGNVASEEAEAAGIEEKYHLQKVKLGEGSFAIVWRAVDKQTGSIVAMKQMLKQNMSRVGMRHMDVQREIAMMKACRHQNILRLFDSFENPSSIYLALEYCDGGDFGDKIKQLGCGLPELEVAKWTWQICSAIAELHSKNICHRDIKPDNFMVSGGGALLKLSDFGLAIYAPGDRLLQDRCGTPAFMAPEQAALPDNSPGYWLPVDMWAAGLTLYMLLFGGRHPFIDDDGQLKAKQAAEGTLDFNGRPQSSQLGDLLSRFGAVVEEPSTAASAPPPPYVAATMCRRMVNTDPRQRLTAQDALLEPWLMQGGHALANCMPGNLQHGQTHQIQPPQLHQQHQVHEEWQKQHGQLQAVLREQHGQLAVKEGTITQLRSELAAALETGERSRMEGIHNISSELAKRDLEISQQMSEMQRLRNELTQVRAEHAGKGDNQMQHYIHELGLRDASLAQRDRELALQISQISELQESVLMKDAELAASQNEAKLATGHWESEAEKLKLELSTLRSELADAHAGTPSKQDCPLKDTGQPSNDTSDVRIACAQHCNALDQDRTGSAGHVLEAERLRCELAARDELLTQRGHELDARDRESGELRTELAKRNRELGDLREELARRSEQLQQQQQLVGDPAAAPTDPGPLPSGAKPAKCCSVM